MAEEARACRWLQRRSDAHWLWRSVDLALPELVRGAVAEEDATWLEIWRQEKRGNGIQP